VFQEVKRQKSKSKIINFLINHCSTWRSTEAAK